MKRDILTVNLSLVPNGMDAETWLKFSNKKGILFYEGKKAPKEMKFNKITMETSLILVIIDKLKKLFS